MGRLRVRLLALVLLLALPLPAAAWGTKGHRVVASLAEDLLTTGARREVAALLDPGTHTLADISTWADDIRPSRPTIGPGNLPRASGP